MTTAAKIKRTPTEPRGIALMPGLKSLRSLVENLSDRYQHTVMISFDHRLRAWFAELGGKMVGSEIGPAHAVEELEKQLQLEDEDLNDYDTRDFETVKTGGASWGTAILMAAVVCTAVFAAVLCVLWSTWRS